MLLIAVIGYFFLKLEIPIAPIVLALILGPLAESNLRRSLLLSQGSASIFFTQPICIFFLLLAVLSLCWPLLRKVLIPPLLLMERVFIKELVSFPMWTTFAPVSRFCPAPAKVTPVNSIRERSPFRMLMG